MAETVAVSTAASAAKKVKAKKPSTHPPFSAMIVDAVKSLKERTGSSRHAILKYILMNNEVGDEKKANSYLKLALKKCVSSGVLTQVKGTGASGSFKVVKEEKLSKSKDDKRVTKVQLAKKTTIKRTKEATAKKTAAKKIIAVKAAIKNIKTATAKKQFAKKTADMKASKKAIAKKSVLKKATKRPISKKSPQISAKKSVTKKPAKK